MPPRSGWPGKAPGWRSSLAAARAWRRSPPRSGRATALALPADCTDEASISAAIDEAATAFGGLDIVVSNAGIELLGEDDRVDRLDLAVWRRLLQNNLDGQFLTCKHGIKHLLASGGGAVVCVGSNCGYLGMATNEPAYSASKGGVFAMMRVMAIDYAREGIRVNMVVPGFIDTPMNAPVMRDADELRYWSRSDSDRARGQRRRVRRGDSLAGLGRGVVLRRHGARGGRRPVIDLRRKAMSPSTAAFERRVMQSEAKHLGPWGRQFVERRDSSLSLGMTPSPGRRRECR